MGFSLRQYDNLLPPATVIEEANSLTGRLWSVAEKLVRVQAVLDLFNLHVGQHGNLWG